MEKEKAVKGHINGEEDLTGRINEELAMTKDSMGDPKLFQYTKSNQKSYNGTQQ